MLLKVDVDRLDDWLVEELKEELDWLDYEYCLPRWAWTNREWYRYMEGRRAILKEIQRILSEEDVYLRSLEFR